jgi:hypothetical protein
MTAIPVTHPDPPRVTLRSPTDLIALTPYLLGFHPSHSLVVVALQDGQVAFAARADLPGHRGPVRAAARQIVQTVARQTVDAVALLGYGPAATADPLLRAVRAAAGRRGLAIAEVVRVDAGRWWSYLCEDPQCCPPEGTPVDPATSEVAAWCAYSGLTAVASRQDLAQRIAPIGEPDRSAMTRATDRADRALQDLLAAVPEAGGEAAAVLAAGTVAVQAAIERYGGGGTLDDDALAWLTVLLSSLPVRDLAWQAITTEQPHLTLWTDVTRRADPALVPAPASLLAFTAWRAGDGALAGLALDRALAADPSYSLAQLLRDALRQGLPPSTLDGWPAVVDDDSSPRGAAAADDPPAGGRQVTRSAPA